MPDKHIKPENFTSNTHIVSSHVLAFIRERFWIVQGLPTVRRVLANYMICRKQNARPGHLNRLWPHSRQNDWIALTDPPFTRGVGGENFGSLFVKQGRSQVKRYGCLFICLTMRVVHITGRKQTSFSAVRINVLSAAEGSPRRLFRWFIFDLINYLTDIWVTIVGTIVLVSLPRDQWIKGASF